MSTSESFRVVASLKIPAGMIACAIATTTAGASNLVVNGSFETPYLAGFNTTHSAGSFGLTGWAIGGQGIDHDSFFQPAHGLQTISTRWVGSSNVSQKVTTAASMVYTLSFAATRERPELVAGMASTRGVDVYWNSMVIGTVTLPPDPTQTNASMNWQYYTFSVVGTGGLDELLFQDIDSGVNGFGVQLDDVRLVPAPGALALLGAGGLMGGRRRR